MIALPIPLIVALVLGFLLVRTVMAGNRPWPFAALLAICAAQGVLVSLVQYYGVREMRFVQPVLASAIPAMAWVTFLATAVRPLEARRDLVHVAVPAFAAFCTLFAPATLDVVLPAIFLIYGLAILSILRRGADNLPLIRLEAGNTPLLIWGGAALAFLVSAMSDTAIAIARQTGDDWLQPRLVSLFSSLMLLWVGAIGVSHSLTRQGGPATSGKDDTGAIPATSLVDATEDARLIERLESLLAEHRLYLDPDLTLSRLARRLGVPAKQLSAAINRSTGDNVSRYINGFRIRAACDRIADGDSITVAMLESGFNTKSNFNREFQRVIGKTPTAWKQAMSESAGDPPAAADTL